MNDIIFVYDGSFEGYLSCVFEVYKRRCIVSSITSENKLQLKFGQSISNLTTSTESANRVKRGIQKKAGCFAFEKCEKVFSTNEQDKEMIILKYIKLALKEGYQVHTMLAHKDVVDFENIVFYVNREIQHLGGFLRFSLMENDVFFAKINSKCNIVPFLMPHFIDRFSDQPFVIYDPYHNIAGIYDTINYKIIVTTEFLLPEYKENEYAWVKLWRKFCDQVAIKERTNLRQQQNFCPKRFWENMPEMQDFNNSNLLKD